MKRNPLLIFQLIQVVIIIAAFSILANGCRCVPCSQKEEVQIPENVIKKAGKFIISKTRGEFFNKYITADFSQSKHIAPNYLMVYKFYMPEKPFVNEQIRFTIDSTGNILKQYEIVGIPDCNLNPMNCDFIVDEQMAKQIASENGLSNGINEWKVDFVWDAKYNKYVWSLLSTLKESRGEFGYRGEGEKLIIDATNASVISKDSWKIN